MFFTTFQVLQLGLRLLSEIEYATFCNYSPRGTSDLSIHSKKVCGAFKNGNIDTLNSTLPYFSQPSATILSAFLNPQITLVPVPRSAPLTDGALWPSLVIAEFLQRNGYGHEVLLCIKRKTAVRKSSSSASGNRPEVSEHYESLEIEQQLLVPDEITLIDDVLTQGRTTIACALRLEEVFPMTKIRIFAMMRTQGFKDDIDEMVEPICNIINYYEPSGKHIEKTISLIAF